MITINLKPEIEAQIREKAKSQNLSVEKYIENLIQNEIEALVRDQIKSQDLFIKNLIEKVEKEVETLIREKANSEELLVKKNIEDLVEQQIIDFREDRQSELSIERWENQLLKFINSPINSRLSPLPDEAINRENIYTREDKNL
ncbi:MAG: hypothetical protein AB4080_23720 [Trichodesmium sp.]